MIRDILGLVGCVLAVVAIIAVGVALETVRFVVHL